MQKRDYAMKTVREFEAAKPVDVEFLSMSLSGNGVKYVKGCRLTNGKPGALLILWDSRGRAFTRYMANERRTIRFRNVIMMYHEGWMYIRDNRFDLFKRKSYDEHTQS